MRIVTKFARLVVAAQALIFATTLWAQDAAGLEEALLEQLAQPEQPAWQEIENQLRFEWARSGSSAMDLLLKRGRDAMDDEDFGLAVEHFTALTDHAPDFAEGWHARATAFFAQEKLGLALLDVVRVLELRPNHYDALNGLGLIQEALGNDRDALAAYRAARAIHPHRPDLKQAEERLAARVDGTSL